MWDLRDPDDPFDEAFGSEDEWEDVEPGTVGPRWIQSRTVRLVIALLVAIAMAAVTAGWWFIGRTDPPAPPREEIEVALPFTAA